MATEVSVNAPAKGRNPAGLITRVITWVLTILLAYMFTLAGGVKLFGVPAMVQEFAQIGLGQWFRYLTGVLEVSGAIGLLVPRLRFWAALQLAVIMVGATLTNLMVLRLPQMAVVTISLLALLLVLAWLRRPERRKE